MVLRVYSPGHGQFWLLVTILLFLTQTAVAQLSGTVFRDFNANGSRETPGEIGVGGVTVTIVSTNGVVTTATTSSVAATLGTYLVVLPGGTGPFRIEFSNLPTGYFAGPKGTNSGTVVQFAAAGSTNVSLGINYPTDYSQANPYFLVPCYVNGDPLSTTGNAGAQGSLVGLPYNSVGDNPSEFPLATGSQIGAVFGVAYQRAARQAYTAAFVKRHSGLGTGGAGAIYLTKATDATFTAFTSSLFTTLPLTIPVATNAARGLPGSTTVVNQDPTVFGQVGKTGLGDIELSEDGTQLYAVNLSDQKLYRIPINNAATNNPTANTAGITSFSIGTGTGCRTGSVYRPFALKAYRGKLYVGGVCTNENVPTSTTVNFGAGTNNTANLITRDTTGMKAIVYEFDPVSSTFASAIAFPLTYKKGNTNNDQNGVERANYWLPWTDVVPGSTAVPSRFARGDAPNISYPQPWLTGIEFDVDGSMILSIRDRTGDQFGNNNLSPISTTTFYRTNAPGDILRASKCTPNAPLWTLENNASVCGGTSTLGLNNGQGPGNGEYYYSDAIAAPNTVTPYHLEMAQGGLALLPGSGDVASIVMDPTTNIEAGGIRKFKNSDGSGSPATSTQIYYSGSGVSTYGKANGLGDLELSSDNPPIEIGNRVWNDGDSQNADGIQGATNTFLSGVTVTLYLNGSPVVSTTTNAAGEYYFNSTNVTGGLLPNTTYEIRIPMNQSALANYIPTVYNAGTDNALDNDGVLVNGFTVITLTTGNYGENNHTYDFGFVTCPTITNPSPAVSVCSGTSVSSLSVATNATGTNTIQFVYFTSPQNGTAMYSGGTSLATATPTGGAATISNVAFPANNTSSAIVYYVYAILTPTPGAVDCRPAQQIPVTINPVVSITITGNPSLTICSGNSTTLTASASGGTSFTYRWNTGTTTPTLLVSPTVATTYSVTVTSNSGCFSTSSATVTVNPAVTIITASASPTTLCSGATSTLTASASGGAGITYAWSNGVTTATQSITPTVTTIYSVTATNSTGCSRAASTTVTVNPAVTAVITASPSSSICLGTSTTLTASGGTVFRWSTGANTAAITVSPTSTTAYSVTVTNASGCSAVALATVTVNPAVTATVASATLCNGTSTTLTANATGGTSFIYAWSPAGTGNTQTVTVSPTTTTTYTVTVTNSNGCSATATATVTVNPAVTAVIAVSPSNTICQGTSATLTASGGTTYRWSTGATTAAISVTPANSTIYSITVTNASGCSAVATSTITVNPAVNATLSSAVICNGATASLTATGGTAYTLSNGATNATGIFTVNPTTTTTYSVTVTNGTGCSAIATGTVTVNTAVTAVVSVSPGSSICQGTSVTIAASGGSFYRFSDGTTVTNNTSGQLVVTPATVGGNPYAVTVTSGQSCSAVASVVVTVNALPQPTILGTSTVCAGGPISLTATPTTGLTYAWSGPGGSLGNSNPLVIPTSTTANSGTYQVRVTDANGCTATASRNVTVRPSPTVQILNTSITCANNQPATAIATQVTGGTPPVTYAWYRSGAAGVISTNANPSFTTPDTYSVIVTDANGCISNTASVTVMTPNPLAVNTQTANPLCFSAQGRITVQASGGTGPYSVSYYSAGGLISSTTTTGTSTLQTAAGSYTVVVMDANGCSLTQTATLTQPPLLVASLTSGGPVCAGQNTGTISSSVTGGTSPYTYAWTGPVNNGATTPNLTGLSGGTYSVVVTDANGCTATQSITIQTNPLPAAPSFTVTQPTCVTTTGTIRILIPATGVTYSFDNGQSYQTSATLSGLAPGVYRLRVKDNTTGCESTVTSATVNAVPTAPIAAIAGSMAYCEGFPISLTASPATGVTYVWSGPGGNLGSSNPLVIPNATPAQSGTYRVTVTDVNGCTATASSVITVNPAIVATVNNVTLTCQNPTATLTVSSSQLNLSYQWRGPAGFTATTQSVTVSTVGTYTVVTTSTQSGCSATATATVTQDVTLPVTTLTSATLTCQNNYAAVTLTATSTPANTTYQWTGPAGFAANTASISTTIPGIYTVVSTNPQTGCSTTLTTTVVQDASVQATLTQSSCLNNNTNAVAADDYFTVTIQATNTGNVGTYEVVLGANANGTGGTVLNSGGTAFGTAVTVGGVGQGNAKGFRADGSSTYPILIRQVGQTNCRVYRLTGTVAPCSSCFPIPCLPVRLQKQ